MPAVKHGEAKMPYAVQRLRAQRVHAYFQAYSKKLHMNDPEGKLVWARLYRDYTAELVTLGKEWL